ncbi:carboxylesterase/lipase family protein [Streptomyces resistomycificus]|uniref:Carboxylic ester hydrolase n=1 Tax=Streptomyces resistomycificus TaxID=67356 RepID=A0A0L8L779_9ACTN|nr:carboxylesterase family protein [Streptomyces resistomycificus]KOG33975.1 carboxylesterase [Streptomyces resistomycificus]KUN96479.1 carboxylesterase [Streptomyces resistomycificus]
MTTTQPHDPVVRTATGAVRGRRGDGLAVFRGIPFAAPPVGEARFQAPRPAAAWDGTRDAYAFGPPPPQDVAALGGGVPPDVPLGDDWLTVNVWTPDPDPAAHRPVMVWLYGGAYKLGHAGSPGYDARHIAHDGDVVVVTLNYRVGIEGFARLDGAPANRGLLDQVAALEWVRDNITAFGGDPGQVTVFGESAGAGSLAALLAMPSASGLFRRAIAQSVPGTYFSDALARDIAAAIATEAGLRPTAADLATVDPRRLTSAGGSLSAKMLQYTDRWGRAAPTVTPFSPVVDGEVLPVTPWQALAAGAGRDVELVVGHNRDEFRLFLAMGGQLGRITEEQARGALRMFAPGAPGTSSGEEAYRAAFPDATPGELFERVQTDWLFAMPSLHLAEAQLAGGGRAHVYELTWSAPGPLGACHALDIPLLFGTFTADFGAMLFPDGKPTAEAEALSSRFRAAWTAFARTGDPGWPAYDTDARQVRVWDVEPQVRAYPEEASRRMWEGYEFAALPLLG